MPKPYKEAEIPIAMALAMGGMATEQIDEVLAEYRDQLIAEFTEIVRNHDDPERWFDIRDQDVAIGLLLTAARPSGDR